MANNILKPTKQFDGQRDDEVIVSLFRRHRIFLVGVLMRYGLFLLVAIWAVINIHNQFRLLLAILIVAVAIKLIHEIVTWYYSFYILTNQRLRYVQRAGMSKSSLLDLPITSIKVVRYFSQGVLSEMLHYGDIIIEADGGELTMTKINQAKTIYNQIQDLINQHGA